MSIKYREPRYTYTDIFPLVAALTEVRRLAAYRETTDRRSPPLRLRLTLS